MCLTIKRGEEPKIAEQDITVYKVVYVYSDGMTTPYQYFPVEMGCKYKSILKRSNNCPEHGMDIGLHSFITLDGAKKEKDWHDTTLTLKNDVCIVECIIPKGSEYIEGTFDTCMEDYSIVPSIASTAIIYKKFVE